MPPQGVRKGFAGLMTAYNGQRVGAATVALGIAEGAFDQAVAYAKSREQFGRPIAEFQGLQWMLADMSTRVEQARALIYRAAWLRSECLPYSREASMAKLFASEMAESVCSDALQVHGGAGYVTDFPVERYYRDARIYRIFDGTSEIHRAVLGGALMRKGPALYDPYG